MTINRVVAAALCAVMLGGGVVGCAEQAPSITTGMAEVSFKAWMTKHDPAAERKENGIYLRFIERSSSTITPTANKSWLRVNYTLYALSGVVGETRNPTVSKLINKWYPITHFVDDLMPYYSKGNSANARICEGLRSSFEYLHPGDSVRIYIPTSLGYENTETGMNVNSGYIGEETKYFNRPCYFDLRVNEVINDPTRWEQQIVEQYLQKRGIAASDSLSRGLYMRILHSNPTGGAITVDSTARYFYAARFLDNHLIYSNVPKVVQKAGYYYSSTAVATSWSTSPVSYLPADFNGTSSSDSTYRSLLAKVLVKCKTGETVEVITTSANVLLGSTGSLTAIPQILPYTPRRLQLRLLKWNDKVDSDLYDWSLFF